MHKTAKKVLNAFQLFGIDLVKASRSPKGIYTYLHELYNYKKMEMENPTGFKVGKLIPCLNDRYEESGTASGHYFHQDLLVAKMIFTNKPVRHIDIGSSINGFVAHVASFREIEVLDVRSLENTVSNIKFTQHDLMQPLEHNYIECCDSLSCLNVLEHFGLGRYRDKLDTHGHIKGFNNLYRMLKPNGKLYFSVPFGPIRVEFNAHRVFSIEYLLDFFRAKFVINSFNYVDDFGKLVETPPLTKNNIENNFGCTNGCAIFELTKIVDNH